MSCNNPTPANIPPLPPNPRFYVAQSPPFRSRPTIYLADSLLFSASASSGAVSVRLCPFIPCLSISTLPSLPLRPPLAAHRRSCTVFRIPEGFAVCVLCEGRHDTLGTGCFPLQSFASQYSGHRRGPPLRCRGSHHSGWPDSQYSAPATPRQHPSLTPRQHPRHSAEAVALLFQLAQLPPRLMGGLAGSGGPRWRWRRGRERRGTRCCRPPRTASSSGPRAGSRSSASG